MLSSKDILSDPQSALETASCDLSVEQREAFLKDVSLLERIIESKSALSASKGLCSRAIGEKKKNQLPFDDLLKEMKSISQEIKELEIQQKDYEKKISTYLFPENNERSFHKKKSGNIRHKEWQPALRWAAASCESSIEKVEIKKLTPEMDSAWTTYVAQHPAANLYHLLGWRDVIVKSFGHNCIYFIAELDSSIVGILPVVQLNSKLFGNFLVSQAFFNYGGALGDSEAIEDKLMKAAASEAASLGCSHVEFRDDFQRAAMPFRSDKVSMMLSLPDTSEKLWSEIGSKLRAQIKRPQKENCSCKIGGVEMLDDFYHVFAINMRDLGTPVYGKQFFRNILEEFDTTSNLVVIYWQAKPVASAFLVGDRGVLEIPWASSLRSANHLGVNMLLYWKVLEFAITKNYQWFDFGRSTVDAGTYKFKRQWGAKPRQLYWHYWLEGGGDLPKLNPTNPKFKIVIEIWKRLPIFVTKILGPMLVKYLP